MTFDEWLSTEGPLLARIGATPVETRQMRKAWAAATAAEREACANIAESFIWYEHDGCAEDGANEFIAKIIRMRSNVPLSRRPSGRSDSGG